MIYYIYLLYIIYYTQSVGNYHFKFGLYRTNIWKVLKIKHQKFASCFSTV
jgi:hypothetical protein